MALNIQLTTCATFIQKWPWHYCRDVRSEQSLPVMSIIVVIAPVIVTVEKLVDDLMNTTYYIILPFFFVYQFYEKYLKTY